MPDCKKEFKVKVNDFVFSLTKEAVETADIIKKSPTEYNIISNHQSVNAKVLDADATGKKVEVEIDGEKFTVEIKDTLDQMLEVMGFGAGTAKQVKEIKAPMPGLVLDVVAKDGDELKEGQKVLILGAMKMENSILLPADAKIKRVAVTVGQAVDKGQLLVELE